MIDPSVLPEPASFRQLPDCLICQFYNCDIYLRCAVHPSGAMGDLCSDFMPFKPASTQKKGEPDRSTFQEKRW